MNKWLATIGAILLATLGRAQTIPEFVMADTTVTACDGRLFDSGQDDQYGIGEDFTFTIASPAPISVMFEGEFCVEIGFDALEVYDGPSTASPLIGSYDGFELPPSFSSTDTLTFHFVSNENVQYCGFELVWNLTAPPPIPPTLTLLDPECETSVVPVSFSTPIGCDWVVPESVNFYSDAQSFNVVGTETFCTDDSTTIHEFQLDAQVDLNCLYTLELEMRIPDFCDSLWTFELSSTIQYTGCPVRVEAFADPEEICVGTCTQIWAEYEGCSAPTYAWNSGDIGPGPHQVCPTETTAYVVTVTETETGVTGTDTVWVDVTVPSIANAPEQYCQSGGPIDLEATPPDGLWTGTGIVENELGLFDPDSAWAGPNQIVYEIYPGCADTAWIDIVPILTDSVVAACTGSETFALNAQPLGGTWTGLNVTTDGMFDPLEEGSFSLNYAANGCLSTTVVNVADLSTELELTTWCQSLWADSLGVTPFGGLWTGPGMVEPDAGIFDPNEAGPGMHTLSYAVEGCSASYEVEVLGIDAGGFDTNACPENPPFAVNPGFSPSGGTWDGWGITNATSGVFDPAILPNDTWTNLIYTAPNGCTDTVFMYVRQTEILVPLVYMCEDSDPLPLTWQEVGRTPGGGFWTGPGVINPDGNYHEFVPATAGVGTHTLVYSNNNCDDDMQVIVHPVSLGLDTLDVCEISPPWVELPDLPGGSTFSGTGIVDAQTGAFDPLLAGPGTHTISWEAPGGCSDQFWVAVEDHLEASISGLEQEYCFQNNAFPLDLQPAAGIVNGPVTDGAFNPAEAGEGSHLIEVVYTGVLCSSSASAETFVLPPIQTEILVDDSLICPGQGASLTATYSGGHPDLDLGITWNQSLIPLNNHEVNPEETTVYVLTATDGCSDPGIDSLTVTVLPGISAQISTSDTACVGDPGWITAAIANPGTFDLFWGPDETPLDTLFATAGASTTLLVQDALEGCQWDTLLLVPNYTPISAAFSPNPNLDCIPFEANPVQFLDLSQYGLTGVWDFGNGDIQEYQPGTTPESVYDTPGEYMASLFILNEGLCPDSAEVSLCILPPSELFVPDAFSPNQDGMNDVLYVRGKGITELELVIYNRWGEAVFKTQDPLAGWDGTHRGEPAPSGNYAYRLVALVNDWKRVEQTGNLLLVR